MTYYSKGLPVSWSRGGEDKATLNKRVPLGGKAALNKRLAF